MKDSEMKTGTETLPLCVECANYAPNRRKKPKPGCPDVRQPLSGRDCIRRTDELDLETGKPVYRSWRQKHERSHGYMLCRILGTCGKEGRFFRQANGLRQPPLPADDSTNTKAAAR